LEGERRKPNSTEVFSEEKRNQGKQTAAVDRGGKGRVKGWTKGKGKKKKIAEGNNGYAAVWKKLMI